MEHMENLEKKTLEIFPDYHNIYIQDKKFWEREDAPDMMKDWAPTEESTEVSHVGDSKTKTMMVFHPYSNMHEVPVTVEMYAKEPALDEGAWDHIVEASLEIKNDELEIGDGMPGTPTIIMKVVPGTYRARICFGNLVEGGQDAEEGDDHYLVSIWPAPMSPLEVVKQWEGFIKRG
jgi:hypothetical protein